MKVQGYQGLIYVGAAGTTASGQSTHSRDISTDINQEKGDTSERGDSAGPVKLSERVTAIGCQLTFTLINDTTDTILQDLLEASALGTPIAIRTKDYASGKGFDGDCDVTSKQGAPYKSEQTIEFTATPNTEERDYDIYV